MKRDLSIDTLRGVVLYIMALYHFGGPLKALVNQPLGYVAGVEGFVYLSGIVFGLVTGKYYKNLKQLYSKAYTRALLIYKHHMALVLFVFFVSLIVSSIFIDKRFGPEGFINDPISTLISSSLLLYQPWMLDILPMFIVYALIGPIIIFGLNRNKELLIILISFSFWLLMPISIIKSNFYGFIDSYSFIDLGYFNIFGWQILFVIGVCFGYRKSISNKIRYFYSVPVVTVMLIVFIILFFLKHGFLQFDFINNQIAASGQTLSWLRLLNFMVIAYLFGWLIKLNILRNIRALSYLGQHSLQVFVFHVYILYLIRPIKYRIQELGDLLMILSSVAFVMILYLPAYYHNNYKFERLRLTKKQPIQS